MSLGCANFSLLSQLREVRLSTMKKPFLGIVAAGITLLGFALAQGNQPTSTLEATFWGIYLLLPLPFLIIGLIAYLLYRSDAKKRRRKPKWVE